MTPDSKNLPPLPEMRYFWPHTAREGYTTEMVHAYGDARAAHARKVALEECAAEIRGMKANSKTAQSAINQCAEALEILK
jgi:hypothetical protein